VSADRIGDEHQPLVGVKSLPTDERGTAVGGERVSDVGESPHGIIDDLSPNWLIKRSNVPATKS
jgi:hypothetical protein